MEIAATIISTCVQSLMDPIKKNLGYWVSSRKYVDNLHKRLLRLEARAEDMKRKKESNVEMNLVVPIHLSIWFKDLEVINRETETILANGIETRCFSIKMRYKVGKQSCYLLKEIDRLEERSNIEWTNEQIPLARVASRKASTSAPVEVGTHIQNSFDSRDLIFNKALKSLEPNNNDTQMLALCGMGGVGKTTMMVRLKKAVVDSKMYDWVVQVCVGQNTDPVAIQHAIIEHIGGSLSETTEDGRAYRLERRFLALSQGGEKKILVIFDDVWQKFDLKVIGLPSPLPSGFKLLITSRDENVCIQMGVQTHSILRMGVLNDTEARSLFFKIVGLSSDDDHELYKIGERIIKGCGNLPFALKIVASMLKDNTKDEWKEVLSRLERYDLEYLNETIQIAFEMSYRYLEREDEKAIFLLCGLFPEDADILIEELIRYSWGLKLVGKVSTLVEARHRVKTCVNSLIHASLLNKGDRAGCVKMPDLARSFVLGNFTKVKQAAILNHDDMSKRLTQDANESSYQRILLRCTGISEFHEGFNFPDLVFLKLMDGDKLLRFPDNFYERMTRLEVVAFESMHIPLLPRRSNNLTTLCLHSCSFMDDLSFLGDLINLQVLSFAESHLRKLPSTIGKLMKLKLLDLTGCVDLCIDDGVFDKLVGLEELYMRTSGWEGVRLTDASCGELERLSRQLVVLEVEFFENKAQPKNVSFKKLEGFKISMGCVFEEQDVYPFRNTLKLVADCKELLECGINELLKKTEQLFLQVEGMSCLDDISPYSFYYLTVLEIFECPDLKYLFTTHMESCFRKLERLTVSSCPVLESLVHGKSGAIKFQKLKFLALSKLPKLGSLCNLDKRVELQQLLELRLEDLPNFTSIYPDSSTSSMQPFFNKQVLNINLEKLKISCMENLKQLWPCEITGSEETHVSMLREIKVSGCDSLVNMFPCNPIPFMQHLESLQVKQCSSIEVLFNIDLGCVGTKEQVRSRLRTIRAKELEKLRAVWRIKGENHSSLVIHGFHDVERIWIYGCPNFRNIFTPKTTNFDMGVHADIRIHDGTHTQTNFESRELTFEKVLRTLEPNSNTQMIALCGIGGVGKTTMMEQLEMAIKDGKMYDWVVKVVIGQNFNLLAIQQAVAHYIGVALMETTIDSRASRLQNSFEKLSDGGRKKTLVILDDVWEKVDLKDIGLTSPLINGLKVLITSRFEDVCTQMGVENNFRVGPLNEVEARTFFYEITKLSDGADPELHRMAEAIIQRCLGLPIALKIIASALTNSPKDAWEDALSRLKQNGFHDFDKKAHENLEMSYNKPQEKENEAVFLLCALFMKDCDIDIEHLLMYAWGLKLLKNVNTLTEARRKINICVNNLIHANLLIKSDKVGCVKLHDMSEQPTQDTTESYEIINCSGVSGFPENFNHPNLALLKLMDGNELLQLQKDFYVRMSGLDVVVYERMHISLSHPQYSTNLRALCLHSCTLMGDLPFLGNLGSLEILSFANCRIHNLPYTIGKLKKLKLLDVTGCFRLAIDDGVFRNLVHLEELYLRVSGEEGIRFTSANYAELEKHLWKLCALEIEFYENKLWPKNKSFMRLQRFRISMGCLLGRDYDDSFKNTLQLVTNSNELQECKVNELFGKTEMLYLQVDDMKCLEDVTTNRSQPPFCNLRELVVFGCKDLKFLFTIPVASTLAKLETLKISSCPVLEALVDCKNSQRGSVIKFPELKTLSLGDVPSLKSLCYTDNVIELPQLVELILGGLPNFTSIFPDNGMQSFFSKEVVLPSLKYLNIYNMEGLKQIWPCQVNSTEEVNIVMLRTIRVRRCDSLVNLFPTNPISLLNHLEELDVSYCGSIEVLFNIDLDSCEITPGGRSLKRIKVYNLGRLREVWRIKGADNSDINIPGFLAVQSIVINYSKRFGNVVTLAASSNFDMRALGDVNVIDCGESGRSNELINNTQEQQIDVISKEYASHASDNICRVAFPSYLMTAFHQLNELILTECKGVEVVFEIESPSSRQVAIANHQPLQLFPHLKVLELYEMERMSHVWRCRNWNEFFIFQPFQNLTTILINDCKNINYLFSPLMAKLLSNLKTIEIRSCDNMEEVVSNRDDENREMTVSASTHTLFPHLDSLTLSNLENLKHIGGGVSHEASAVIYDQFKGVSWSLCQYSREISISNCDALSSAIPSYALGQTHKLQVLKIKCCYSMTEVFETQGINNGCGCSTVVDEGSVGGRKQINTLQLANLRRLEIKFCPRLEHIFTFYMLASLGQLEELTIKDCEALNVIVKEENGEQTRASNFVQFSRLKTISLENLPSLEGFFLGMCDFQWPLLDYLMIKDCPSMRVFTSGQSTLTSSTYTQH